MEHSSVGKHGVEWFDACAGDDEAPPGTCIIEAFEAKA
jgi:hypothetical protein